MNNSDWLQKVEVGDTVIISNRYSRWFDKVKRLTKTQIIVTKHDQKFNKTYGSLVGDGQYNWTQIHEATPEATAELLDNIKRANFTNIMENVVFNYLSTDQLERIVEVINE